MKNIIKRALYRFKKDLVHYFENEITDVIVYGSVIRGGFNPKKSDIDFIVLVKNKLTDEDIAWIRELHIKYRTRKGLESLLEGRYISFNDNKFLNGYYIGTNPKGWKLLLDIGLNNIESAMILDRHESLYELDSISSVLNYNWTEIKNEICDQIDGFIKSDQLMTSETYKDYALITAARSLYTYLEKGFISKPQVKMWIEQNFIQLDYNNPRECIIKIRKIINQKIF